MKLYVDPSVTTDTLHDIASDMGIICWEPTDRGIRSRGKYAGKRLITFVLRPDRSKPKVRDTRSRRWQLVRDNPFNGAGMGVRGDGRRNVFAVCWHGHWEFMMSVFDRDADAVFDTREDVWNGRTDFLARAEVSGMRNNASRAYPEQYREQCDCDLNGGYMIRTTPNPVNIPV